jgi:hypothetical protein
MSAYKADENNASKTAQEMLREKLIMASARIEMKSWREERFNRSAAERRKHQITSASNGL